MTTAQMIHEYIVEILAKHGRMPSYKYDPKAMQIAKLDDAWRKALKG